MRLEAEERAYQRSVNGYAPIRKEKREPTFSQSGLKFATNFATQVFVAFVGAFLFGYYFVETFVSEDNFSAKVIFGAACSFATLLLETCLLVVHEQKQRMIEQKKLKEEQREEKQRRRVQKAVKTNGNTSNPPAETSTPESKSVGQD